MRAHKVGTSTVGWIGILTAIGLMAACSNGASVAGSAAGSSSSAAQSGTAAATNIKLPSEITKRGTLKVGVSTLYPPFIYLKENKVVGYEMDILNAVARQLGVRLDLTRVEFGALIPGLQAKRFDMAASGISDTAEREAIVDFIDYSGTYSAILLRKGVDKKVSELQDLCGLAVGVPQGTLAQKDIQKVAATCASNGREPMRVSVFKDASSELIALEAGRIDAMPNGLQTAIYNASMLPDKVTFVDTHAKLSPFGTAVLKGNNDLVNAINTAVQNLDKDGTLLSIHKKWNLDPAYLHPTGINLATKTSNG